MMMLISQRCNFSPPAKVMSGLWFKGLLLWRPDLSSGQLVCLRTSVFVSFYMSLYLYVALVVANLCVFVFLSLCLCMCTSSFSHESSLID